METEQPGQADLQPRSSPSLTPTAKAKPPRKYSILARGMAASAVESHRHSQQHQEHQQQSAPRTSSQTFPTRIKTQAASAKSVV